MAHIDVGESGTVAYRCGHYDYLAKWHLEGGAPENLSFMRLDLTADEISNYRRYFPRPLTLKNIGDGLPTDANSWEGVLVPASQQQVA